MEHKPNSLKLVEMADAMRGVGASETAIQATLTIENEHCDPRLSKEQIEEIAKGDPLNNQRKRTAELTNLSEVTPREPTWIWRNYLPQRSVTLVVGEVEMGKSYLYTYFASVISQGGVFVDGEPSQPANVVIMSTEDTPEEVIRPRADAFGANNKPYF